MNTGILRTTEDGSTYIGRSDLGLPMDANLTSMGWHISDSNPMRFAIWNGHQFETIEGTFVESSRGRFHIKFGKQPHEYLAALYYPIDPRMAIGDIVNATTAYPNADNTGWLFAHCDKDFHIDHEFKLLASITTVFERQMHALHKVLRTATYSALLSSTSDSRDAFGAASRAYDYLGNFREDVKAHVLAEARKVHLGYYHQNPHEAHIHDPVEKAILAVGQDWVANKQAIVWQSIQAQVGFVLAAVQKEHDYETRWDRLVNAPRRGEDPVGGYEYCYTAVTSKHVIEGHDNLPDPNWDFDHLRNGQVLRGNYTYRDDEPKASAFLFVAVRFRRPIPEGTRPGQDIDRVEWVQDPAYLIPTS